MKVCILISPDINSATLSKILEKVNLMCQLCDCLEVVFFKKSCIVLFEHLQSLKNTNNINILFFNYEKKYISLKSVDDCHMQNYLSSFNSINKNFRSICDNVYFSNEDMLTLNLLNKCDFCITDHILPRKIIDEVVSNVKIITV